MIVCAKDPTDNQIEITKISIVEVLGLVNVWDLSYPLLQDPWFAQTWEEVNGEVVQGGHQGGHCEGGERDEDLQVGEGRAKLLGSQQLGQLRPDDDGLQGRYIS